MNLKFLSQIYLSGLLVLLGAILINWLASYSGLFTWYDFLKLFSNQGLSEILASLTVFNFFFLFLVYPFFLGLIAYVSSKLVV